EHSKANSGLFIIVLFKNVPRRAQCRFENLVLHTGIYLQSLSCTNYTANVQKKMNGNDITPVQQMLASGSGAMITSLFMTPFDVIKIRMQSQRTTPKCFLYCNGLMDHMCYCLNGNTTSTKWYKRPSAFQGTFHGMVQIARNEGITSLWSGLAPTLVMAVPATMIYFTSYDQLKLYFSKHFGQYAPVLAGAVARAGTVTVISPLELIRTKMQSKSLTYREIVQAVRSSVEVGGLRSMWIGLGPTILRDVPFSMMYWYMYEQLKKRIYHESLFVNSFICGFSAGMIAAVITQPLDVVKTKRQITLGEMDLMGVKANGRTSTLYLLQQIIRESGNKGLFIGIFPRCLKIAPACAIMISSYELGKKFFKASDDHNI
ncbi:unnamed protein product, partial [Clavelina lepadiformis]